MARRATRHNCASKMLMQVKSRVLLRTRFPIYFRNLFMNLETCIQQSLRPLGSRGVIVSHYLPSSLLGVVYMQYNSLVFIPVKTKGGPLANLDQNALGSWWDGPRRQISPEIVDRENCNHKPSAIKYE